MIFTINKDPEAFDRIMTGPTKTASDLLGGGYDDIPILQPYPGHGLVDVVNNFPWTKTRNIKEQEHRVPTLTMHEMYITQPAFIANLRRGYSQIKEVLKAGANAAADIIGPVANNFTGTDPVGSLQNSIKDFLTRSNEQSETLDPNSEIGKAVNFFTSIGNIDTLDFDVNKFKYLRPYQGMYGVKSSKFKYRLPYFVDEFKTINNKFSPGLAESIVDSGIGKNIQKIIGTVSTGFGIDFAKIYDYVDEGPEVTFSFLLDNTYDSFTGAYNSPAPYQQNFELVFLLLYQNLPAKVNTLLTQPPVIYSARVPGMFRYLYSYISKLQVECVGNRMLRQVSLTETKQVPLGDVPALPGTPEELLAAGWNQAQIDAASRTTFPEEGTVNFSSIIPEAFKVTITLKSLLPETKNTYMYCLEDEMYNIQIRNTGKTNVPVDKDNFNDGQFRGDEAFNAIQEYKKSLPAGGQTEFMKSMNTSQFEPGGNLYTTDPTQRFSDAG